MGAKSLISYYGGKWRMSSHIVPLIPRHTVYVEPFAGGLSVMFAKPYPKLGNIQHYREVVNDIDENLTNFYMQLRDNGDELTRLLSLTPYSQKECELARNLDIDDKLEKARRYFVNVGQRFGKNVNGGWGTGKVSENHVYAWANRVDRLPEFIERMRLVYISCEDALHCIKRWDSPHTLFYCDPPYPNTNQGHYAGYTSEDYQHLINTLDGCVGNFILSCYPQDNLIPDGWEAFEFDAVTSVSNIKTGDKRRKEMVYRRLNTMPVSDEIERIYNRPEFNVFAKPERQIGLL